MKTEIKMVAYPNVTPSNAIQELKKLGINIIYQDSTKIQFQHLGKKVTLFPYSGWHSGTTIKDGRGIDLLLKQLQRQ